ncbi:MAG: polyphosphate kinase 2 family protein [Luteitalea sp.]|nr:polyphosphate kinase 2 family protein [Luteitalea sp.]
MQKLSPDRFRVKPGTRVKLARWATDDTAPFTSGKAANRERKRTLETLFERQERLWAADRWSVLLVLQAPDAAGKDGTIEHVMRGLNPQGVRVTSFKSPSSEELDHDYLWRVHHAMPRRGSIGVFNRSHYEEVVVARVHPDILAGQKLPRERVTAHIWEERFEDINAMERHLWRNGTLIRKCFLHVSKGEQLRRFLARLDEPAKQWKFSADDLEKRKHWRDYERAYEDMLSATSTDLAPWYIVPADKKWFMRLVVARILLDALEHLNPQFPKVSAAERKTLAAIRRELQRGAKA